MTELALWMRALVTLTVCDVALGLLYAFLRNRLHSEICRQGMTRKVTMYILIGVTYVVSEPLNRYLPFSLVNLLVGFFCVSEFLSVVRYAGLLGVPLPKRLVRALEELRESLDGDKEPPPSGGGGLGGGSLSFRIARWLVSPLRFLPRL